MEIILRKDVEKLGKAGETVKVKDGYAGNFLIPKGLALEATPNNFKLVEEEKKTSQNRIKKEIESAKAVAEKLVNISCTVRVKVGEDDKLFGSVTSADIVRSLESEGIQIDKKKICLDQPIKEVGIFRVPVKLHPEVTADVKVWVVKE